MHILILEARLTGHHPVYLEKIAAGMMNAGHRVTVVIAAQDAEHPCLSSLRQRFSDSVSVYLIDDTRLSGALSSRLGDPGREIAMRRLYAETFRQVDMVHKVDHVLLPYLDYCLHAIALLGTPFGTTPWSGICMRPSFHYAHCDVIAPKPKYAAIKEWLFFRLLRARTLKKLLTIDEPLHDYVTQRHPALQSRISYLPDPAELRGTHTYESAREALGIMKGQNIVLVYGAIDARKGLEELLVILGKQDMSDNTGLLLVGKQSDWAKSHLSNNIGQQLRHQGRLYELNSFVNDDIQQMVFSASDLVWLGYKGHYAMSGVLVLSALARKPVISTSEGLIGWYTRKYNLGNNIDFKQVITNPIKTIIALPENKICTPNFPDHSWSNATKIIAGIVS